MSGGRKTNLSRGSNELQSNEVQVEETMFQTMAGVAGNVLEWYDFALFGYFSDVIAKNFFPPELPGQENENLLKTFLIFGGAFIMRPIGGLVIGYIGDKHGRKKALTKSLFLMAVPTTLMGCLPTYETAGIWSTILLVICRLIQGVSVGGQLPASLVYTIEKHDRSEWGYYGSLPIIAAEVGALLGNITGAFMRSFMSEEQILSWGWRIPFLSGILIGVVALYLHKHGPEVHTNANVYDRSDSEVTNPISVALEKGNRLALITNTLTPTLYSGGFYVTFVWMAIFMADLLEPPIENAFWINAGTLLFGLTCVMPIAGHLSDKIGSRIKLMVPAALSMAISGPFLVTAIANSYGSPFTTVLCQWFLGFQLAFFGGPLLAWMTENFSPEVRLTSVSLGYDLSHALIAGFSPAVATSLYMSFDEKGPGLIYTTIGLISVLGIYLNYFFGIAPADEQSNNDSELKELPEVA